MGDQLSKGRCFSFRRCCWRCYGCWWCKDWREFDVSEPLRKPYSPNRFTMYAEQIEDDNSLKP